MEKPMKITPDMLRNAAADIANELETYMCIALKIELSDLYGCYYRDTHDTVKEFFASFDVPLSGNLGFTRGNTSDIPTYNKYSQSTRVMFLEMLALYLEETEGAY